MHDEEGDKNHRGPSFRLGQDAEERQILPQDLRELKRGLDPTPKCWKHPVLLSTPLQKYNGNQMNKSSWRGGSHKSPQRTVNFQKATLPTPNTSPILVYS